ncbi:MAG: hypothetical protein ABI183_25355 [Polyangiaceae bacterium]
MTSICGECGVIGTESAACVHCGSQAPRLDVPARTDGANWICLECTIKCRMCGFRVPLNGLDMDGAVICARCSLEQAFDVEQWRIVFEEAHATGDLWGDQATAFGYLLDAQYFNLGKVNASLVFNGTGENAVDTLASPGYPLCDACHKPLDVKLGAPESGHATTTCTCGETASYETPAAARRMSLPLTAIICSEHRSDRKDVRVDATESAIAVRCPGCDAPLPANSETKFVTCAYCHVQARIPDRTWFMLSKKEHVPEKMWLLFKGPSGTRVDLSGKQQRNHDVRDEQNRASAKRHEREVREAEEAVEKAKRYAAKEKKRDADEAARTADRDRKKAEDKRRERIAAIVVPVSFVLLVAVIGIYQTSKEKARDAKALAIEKATPHCTAETPADCMKTAQRFRLIPNNNGNAIDDYEVGCNAGYQPACDAVEALCQSPTIGISTRLNHFERYCGLKKFDDCNAAGNLYVHANGDGLGKDESAASFLFKTSCDGGNQAGCDLLAQSCKRGVKQSCPAQVDAGHHH